MRGKPENCSQPIVAVGWTQGRMNMVQGRRLVEHAVQLRRRPGPVPSLGREQVPMQTSHIGRESADFFAKGLRRCAWARRVALRRAGLARLCPGAAISGRPVGMSTRGPVARA